MPPHKGGDLNTLKLVFKSEIDQMSSTTYYVSTDAATDSDAGVGLVFIFVFVYLIIFKYMYVRRVGV